MLALTIYQTKNGTSVVNVLFCSRMLIRTKNGLVDGIPVLAVADCKDIVVDSSVCS